MATKVEDELARVSNRLAFHQSLHTEYDDDYAAMGAGAEKTYVGILRDRENDRIAWLTARQSALQTALTGGGTPSRDLTIYPYTAQGAWNHPLGDGATWSGALAVTTAWLNAGGNSHPVFQAMAGDPVITCTGQKGTLLIQIPATALPADSGDYTNYHDHHMHVILPDKSAVHQFFFFRWTGPTTATYGDYYGPLSRYGGNPYDCGSLSGSGMATDANHLQGTRAYGGSAIGGMMRLPEVQDAANGNIHAFQHVLACALDYQSMVSPQVWPAVTQDSSYGNYSGAIPMGALLGIPPATDLSAHGINTNIGRAMAQAMQDYGIYVVDTSAWQSVRLATFYAEPTADSLCFPGNYNLTNDLTQHIIPLLRRVTNNASNNIGGGGTPRRPYLSAP